MPSEGPFQVTSNKTWQVENAYANDAKVRHRPQKQPLIWPSSLKKHLFFRCVCVTLKKTTKSHMLTLQGNLSASCGKMAQHLNNELSSFPTQLGVPTSGPAVTGATLPMMYMRRFRYRRVRSEKPGNESVCRCSPLKVQRREKNSYTCLLRLSACVLGVLTATAVFCYYTSKAPVKLLARHVFLRAEKWLFLPCLPFCPKIGTSREKQIGPANAMEPKTVPWVC